MDSRVKYQQLSGDMSDFHMVKFFVNYNLVNLFHSFFH